MQISRVAGRVIATAIACVALVAIFVGQAGAQGAIPHRLQSPSVKVRRGIVDASSFFGLISNHDGRCLDEDVSTPPHDHTRVQMWTCNGWLNQEWYYYSADSSIRNVHDGRCLDVPLGSSGDGTPVQMYSCNGGYNQRWYVYNDGTIRSGYDGRCLDEDVSTPTYDGTKVQTWSCNGWNNQGWWRFMVPV